MDLVGVTIGSYRVSRRIGAGGMGEVFEVVHPTIGKRLAAKVLSPVFARRTDIAARFFEEARAANLIGHPGIIDVMDHGELSDGRPYLLMELLDGESVGDRLAREGALPLGDIAAIMGGALDAIDAAHRTGIVHRDLKPDNLFACSSGRIVVLDFGIAKLSGAIRSGQVRTRTGELLGTPRYMAPEQAIGQVDEIDARSDVYAMGATLYEMVTGRPPFAGATLAALLEEQVRSTPPPPSDLRRALPPLWNEIVMRAMAKNPAERYPSARALAEAIAAAPIEQLRALGPEDTTIGVESAERRGPTPILERPTPRLPDLPATGRARGLAMPLLGVALALTVLGLLLWDRLGH